MRKDIFLVGIRLLGVWQLCGAMVSLAYIISEYAGYVRPQPSTHEYTLIRLGVELIMGLFLINRPQKIFHFVKQLSANEDEDQSANGEVNEAESEAK